jgi:DNA-directed RNA polymerase specialized sigma24 family protein
MAADPFIVFSEGKVAETPQGLRVVLIDHARRRAAGRHGGGTRRVALDAVVGYFEGQRLDLVAVHEALERPAKLDGLHAQVMALRYFGDMTVAEVAAALRVSVATVEHDWPLASDWLAGQLGGSDG